MKLPDETFMDELRLSFSQLPRELAALTDADFARAVDWSDRAGARLKRAAQNGDVRAVGQFVARALAARGGNRRPGKVTSGKNEGKKLRRQSLWSKVAADPDRPRTTQLVELWESFTPAGDSGSPARPMRSGNRQEKRVGKNRKYVQPGGQTDWPALEAWLQSAAGDVQGASPVELLILFEILRECAPLLQPELLFRLWRFALCAAVEHCAGTRDAEQWVAHPDQLLFVRGELPWEAALLFSNVSGAGRVRRTGRQFLRRHLEEHTDEDGTPTGGLLERLPLWLAPLVRSTEWGRQFRDPLWDDAQAERFELLLERVAAICRMDGKLALSNGHAANVVSLLTSASRLTRLKKKSPPIRYLRAVRKNVRGKKVGRFKARRRAAIHKPGKKPYPVAQSDWARLACLRNDWSVHADSLLVAHHAEKPLIELIALGQPLLSGTWDIEVTVGTTPAVLQKKWDCCCWFSDHDADYLELTLSLGRNVKIDRQVLLSRKERFGLLADVVTSGGAATRIEYASSLPLADGVHVTHDVPTRECLLEHAGVGARVFPLSLPDDRLHGTSGYFGDEPGLLRLRHSGIGGIYAPLVVDWAPERKRSHAEWRSLTVSEAGSVVGRETAAGFRIRVGKQHLFIYRSLRKSQEMRAVLGHHTAFETVIGTFSPAGEVRPIIMVE